MPAIKPKVLPSLAARLKKAGIRHFDQLIHEQSEEWLIKNLAYGEQRYKKPA